MPHHSNLQIAFIAAKTTFFDREQSSKVLKEALLLFLLLLAGNHSETNKKMVAIEQIMFLEQNYGIDLPCMALYKAVDGRSLF